jgi:hypothetical protein
MTAIAELERIARVAPTTMHEKATGFRLVVDVEACDRLANGAPSGLVAGRPPRTRFGVAWIVDGRYTAGVIAWFDRQDDAHTLSAVLSGERPTSRPGSQASRAGDVPPPAVPTTVRSETQPEASVDEPTEASLASPAAVAVRSSLPDDDQGANQVVGAMPGICAHCGGPLPEAALTGRPRLTCSDACRKALNRVTKPEAVTDSADGRSGAGRRQAAPPPAGSEGSAGSPNEVSNQPHAERREGGDQLGLPIGG